MPSLRESAAMARAKEGGPPKRWQRARSRERPAYGQTQQNIRVLAGEMEMRTRGLTPEPPAGPAASAQQAPAPADPEGDAAMGGEVVGYCQFSRFEVVPSMTSNSFSNSRISMYLSAICAYC